MQCNWGWPRLSLRESSACQKSLAEFRVRRRESNTIRFLPRHVRGGKHFARSERRIVRYRRTTEAQNAANLSRKSGRATFSTASALPPGELSPQVTERGLQLFPLCPRCASAASPKVRGKGCLPLRLFHSFQRLGEQRPCALRRGDVQLLAEGVYFVYVRSE